MPRVELTGKRFGRWKVVSFSGRDKHGQSIWSCVCDCGNTKDVLAGNLIRGLSRSCGCLAIEMSRKANTIHGHKSRNRITKEYISWRSMNARCKNPRHDKYAFYGGRGIKVKYSSFKEFLDDVGPAPSANHTIDRIDNNKHYEPGNCRWATKIEQANNMRSNVHVSYKGKRMTIAQLSRYLGITYGKLHDMIRNRKPINGEIIERE